MCVSLLLHFDDGKGKATSTTAKMFDHHTALKIRRCQVEHLLICDLPIKNLLCLGIVTQEFFRM